MPRVEQVDTVALPVGKLHHHEPALFVGSSLISSAASLRAGLSSTTVPLTGGKLTLTLTVSISANSSPTFKTVPAGLVLL